MGHEKGKPNPILEQDVTIPLCPSSWEPMTPTFEEIERFVGLTKQDTEEAWEAADILDKNNQFRDWLIQEVKILNGAILGWHIVEELLKEKVKSLEGRVKVLTSWDKELQEDLRKAEAKVKSLEADLADESAKVKSLIRDLEKRTANFSSLAEDFSKAMERVKELEIDKTRLVHLHEVSMEREDTDKARG